MVLPRPSRAVAKGAKESPRNAPGCNDRECNDSPRASVQRHPDVPLRCDGVGLHARCSRRIRIGTPESDDHNTVLVASRADPFTTAPLPFELTGATPPTGPLPAHPTNTRIASIDVDATTITELQRAMNNGQLSSEQLTRFYLRRIRDWTRSQRRHVGKPDHVLLATFEPVDADQPWSSNGVATSSVTLTW
jgi:hypothetical protein